MRRNPLRAIPRALRNLALRRLVGVIAALAVFMVGAVGALAFYRGKLADNLTWTSAVNVERETRVIGRMFELAKTHGLTGLRRDEASGRLLITPPSCEQTMLKPTETADPARTRALTLLCTSPQGAEVRAEIEAWNSSYDFLAVRDNRSQNDDCRSSERPGEQKLKVEVYVPYGCKPNEWDLARIVEGGEVAAAWMQGAEPPAEQYDFIIDTRDPTPYAGDWARVSPDPATNAHFVSRYQLTSKDMTLPLSGVVTINVVGRLRSIRIGNDTLIVDTNKPDIDNWRRLGGAFVRVWLVCHEDDVADPDDRDAGEDAEDGEEVPDCTAEPAAGDQVRFAYQIDIAQSARGTPDPRPRAARKFNVVLQAETNTYLPKYLREGEDRRGAVLRLTRHLHVVCNPNWLKAKNPVAECQLDWRRIDGAVAVNEGAKHRIWLGKGPKNDGDPIDPEHDLVNPENGLILPQAFQQGFAPIVGLGPQDWGSLTATLASRPSKTAPAPLAGPAAKAKVTPEVFRLTFDPRIQQAALDTLSIAQGCRSKRSNKETAPAISCRKLEDQHTATLVVLDAEKNPGDILALASLPTPPRRLHMWDLAAIEEGEFGHAGLGWRAVTGDNVPGSTFKAVTAMTAILAATSPSTTADFANPLRRLLLSSMTVAEQVDFLRLGYAPPAPTAAPKGSKRPRIGACQIDRRAPAINANAAPAPNADHPQYCGRNVGYRKNPSIKYWQARPASATGCPSGTSSGGEQFGMCEAIMVSSNLFYGGLGQRLFSLPPIDGEPPVLRMAHRLTFGVGVRPRQPGAPPLPAEIKRTFDLTRGKAPSLKLDADPVNMRAAQPGEAQRNAGAIVRSGYGDDVTATPLAIATIYASLATGKIVRPTMVPLNRDERGCPTGADKADDEECGDLLPSDARNPGPLFESLHAGFRAVAKGLKTLSAVSDLVAERRLHLKTGTATVVRGRRFSNWIAGWVEGKPGTNIPTRISFACFFTHRADNDFGGTVCGPVINTFLSKLAQTPLAP